MVPDKVILVQLGPDVVIAYGYVVMVEAAVVGDPEMRKILLTPSKLDIIPEGKLPETIGGNVDPPPRVYSIGIKFATPPLLHIL